MFEKRAARRAEDRRHQQLLRIAQHIVSRVTLERRIEDIDVAEIVAVAFGRHQLRITEDEALDYLNAVLAERGYPLRTVHPALPGTTSIPAQRNRKEGEDQ